MKSFSLCSVFGIMLALSMPINALYGKDSKTATADSSTSTAIERGNESSKSLEILKEGNARFVSGKAIHINQDMETLKNLTKGQNPKCIVVSCSDSRVPPEIVFDQGLGDIFSIRTAGNVMSDYEEGSIEYAVEHLHTPLLIVMGHQGCGAIQALLDNADNLGDDHEEVADHVSKILQKLASEEEQQEILQSENKDAGKAVLANVMNGVRQLRTSDPVLQKAYEAGELQIVGAIYHLDSGEVEFLDI